MKDERTASGKITCYSTVSQEQADKGVELMKKALDRTMEVIRGSS